MGRYRLAIFDVDGTLLDTSEGVLSSVKYAIEEFGYEEPEEEVLRSFIGPPVQKSFARVYGVTPEKADEMAAVFRDCYKNRDLLKAVPYDGIYKCFEILENIGIKTAIATYKREDYALSILQHFEFDKYTKVMHGSDMDGTLSKSDIIEMCIRESGAKTDEAVMVGDTDNDAKGAAQLGVDFIGVTFGFGWKSGERVANYPCIGMASEALQIADIIKGDTQ